MLSSRGDLCRSWDVVNTMLELQLGSIRVSIPKSVCDIEHRCNTQFYSRLHSFILRQCIQHIGKELEMIKFVGCDKTTCGCFIKTTHGLPCVCELAGYQIQRELIPLDSIHVFWGKIFIEEHEVTQEDSGT